VPLIYKSFGCETSTIRDLPRIYIFFVVVFLTMPSAIPEAALDGGINLKADASSNKLNDDLQRYILDTDPLHLAFYTAFCGWRLDTKIDTENFLGSERQIVHKEYKIDDKSRIMNESGADYLYSSTLPLIIQTTETSNLSYKVIYKLWNGKIDRIAFALLESIYLEGNPYEIKQHRIADVVSVLASLSAITLKALEGFTLKQITETFISTYLQKQNIGEVKTQGLLDKFKNAMQKS